MVVFIFDDFIATTIFLKLESVIINFNDGYADAKIEAVYNEKKL